MNEWALHLAACAARNLFFESKKKFGSPIHHHVLGNILFVAISSSQLIDMYP